MHIEPLEHALALLVVRVDDPEAIGLLLHRLTFLQVEFQCGVPFATCRGAKAQMQLGIRRVAVVTTLAVPSSIPDIPIMGIRVYDGRDMQSRSRWWRQ